MGGELQSRRAAIKTIGSGLAVAPAILYGQSRQEKGKEFVMDALKALGGDVFLNIQTQYAAGRAYSFYNANVRGLARISVYDRFEPMQKDADQDWLPVSRREVYTEKGDYYSLFRNGKGWEVTFQGARPLAKDIIEKYRIATRRDFHYFLRYRLNEPGLYYYHPGVEIVDNTPTNAVEITDSEGETITVYMRQSDGLPLQQLYTRRDPKTRIPYEEKTVWSRYRPTGGAMLPWNVRRERDDEKVYEQFSSTYEVNRTLRPELFELSRKTTILPPSPY